jgi:hypothetical protein
MPPFLCMNCITVAVLAQILLAASATSNGEQGSGSGSLAKLLSESSMIQTCDQIDALMAVLKTRRVTLEKEEQAAQLQLLQLFLLESKYGLHPPVQMLLHGIIVLSKSSYLA